MYRLHDVAIVEYDAFRPEWNYKEIHKKKRKCAAALRLSQPQYQTKDEKPGRGARDRAILFIMIWPPFRLTTALLSGSESV